MPGAVQARLGPGDGDVYILPMLHWASHYSSRLRRIMHGGFATLTDHPELDVFAKLSPSGREMFRRWAARTEQSVRNTEAAMRAALAGDPAGLSVGDGASATGAR